jgi:uncharacterized protein YcaQ
MTVIGQLPVRRAGRRAMSQGCGTIPLVEELSADEARRVLLWRQGFIGTPDRRAGVPGVLARVGLVQLDTISVLARSHELVAFARLGAVGRSAVEDAYWGESPLAFEYWGHAAAITPIDDWPWFAFRRRRYAGRYPETTHEVSRGILTRLRAEGPLTATQLGGAKGGKDWWDWSEVKHSVERLLSHGDVVCVRRVGWRRVYDLPERVIPAKLREPDHDDATCIRELVRRAGFHLGVATEADLADYYRLTTTQVRSVVGDSGLVRVDVRRWPSRAWADPAALDALRSGIRGRHRTTLLSPFDSLVWDRARTERVFGFTHRLEAYVPQGKRVHGYFTMPVLAGGKLVGRVDPGREGSTLVAKQVSIEPRAVGALAGALREAAGWVGATDVRVEQLTPASVRGQLDAALLSR